MTLPGLGIRSKLIFAFSSVVSGTLLACIIGVAAFDHIAKALGEISGTSVPLMSESMELSQSGMTLSAVLPMLANATTQDQRQLQAKQAQSVIGDIEESLNAHSVGGQQNTGSLKSTQIESLSVGTRALDSAVERRLDSSDRVRQQVTEADQTLTSINYDLVAIIERESTVFFDSTDDILGENLEIIDSFLGAPFESLLASVKMLSNLASLEHWLVRAEGAANHSEWKQSVEISLASMASFLSESKLINLGYLDDPKAFTESINALDNQYHQLRSVLEKPVRDLSEQQLDSAAGARVVISVRSDLVNTLTRFADTQQFLLTLNGDELRNSTNTVMPELLRSRINVLSALHQLRAEMNTLAGIIGQTSYVGSLESLSILRVRFEQVGKSIVDLLDSSHIVSLQSEFFNVQAVFVGKLVDQARQSRDTVGFESVQLLQLIERGGKTSVQRATCGCGNKTARK